MLLLLLPPFEKYLCYDVDEIDVAADDGDADDDGDGHDDGDVVVAVAGFDDDVDDDDDDGNNNPSYFVLVLGFGS